MAKTLTFGKKQALWLKDMVADFDLMITNTLAAAEQVKVNLEESFKQATGDDAKMFAQELERLKKDAAYIEIAIHRTAILKKKIDDFTSANNVEYAKETEGEGVDEAHDNGTTNEPHAEVSKEA